MGSFLSKEMKVRAHEMHSDTLRMVNDMNLGFDICSLKYLALSSAGSYKGNKMSLQIQLTNLNTYLLLYSFE